MPTIQWDTSTRSNSTTPSSNVELGPITWDDATWILTSSFIIFTMQSGFGLLEAGAVSGKNEVNIMVKNAADVIFGGLSYWMVGFGLSFGIDEGVNPFCGVGYFFVDSSGDEMGLLFATFVFQLSFATTATTIVSGAMAERTKLTSYIIFSFLNTVVYCIPAHWIWSDIGFLRQLGCVDIAGSGGVHLVGGVSAFVAAYLLKPRLGRYDNGTEPLPMGNAVNSIIGLFMLWWGWLGFNCGSTFGISGGKWKLAAKAAVVTLNGSMGGGAAGIFWSVVTKKGKYDVSYIVNSVLGGLVSITAGCAVIRPWEAIIVGTVGGLFAIWCVRLMDKIRIDDPVGAVGVHGVCGAWGLIAVGFFCKNDTLQNLTQGRNGVVHGGGFYLLGVQALTIVCLIVWTTVSTLILLLPLHLTVGIRLSPSEEILGADVVEHCITVESSSSKILFASRSNSVVSVNKQLQLENQRRITIAQLSEGIMQGIANLSYEEEPGPSLNGMNGNIETKDGKTKGAKRKKPSESNPALCRLLRCIVTKKSESPVRELSDFNSEGKTELEGKIENGGVNASYMEDNETYSLDSSQNTLCLDDGLGNSQQTLF